VYHVKKRSLLAVGFAIAILFCAAPATVFAQVYGDFNSDGIVDANDLPDFFAIWLVNDCGATAGFDFDGDCTITFHDFSRLAGNWHFEPVGRPQVLMVPPMAYDDSSVTLIWSKPSDYSNVVSYNVYRDGVLLGNTTMLFYNVTGLVADTSYVFTVRALNAIGDVSVASDACWATTAQAPAVFYPESYGAVANGTTKDTVALQAAINACTPGGKVHLRAGKTFLSGALFLKSDMTLQIDGTLKGTAVASDYPQMPMRFEGEEQICYSALINVGNTLLHTYGGQISNVAIRGSGTVSGGGDALATAQGRGEMRGRLIYMANASDVNLQGLALNNPPAWTVHLVYSTNITVQGISVNTTNISNGDGCNPDSSSNIYIFNNTFNTGDDCIAIKSGKNLEGYNIGMPTSNVRITNCTFLQGHGGVTIGSESSGGVNHVFAQDCTVQGNEIGLRMKTCPERGGIVEYIEIRDWTMTGCTKAGVHIITNYTSNPGGTPAPTLPICRNITVANVSVTSSTSGFYIVGQSSIHITNLLFTNCTFNGTYQSSLTYVDYAMFTGCTIPGGFGQSNCANIIQN
jgi:exo-poly-alpha-galacturonosidase